MLTRSEVPLTAIRQQITIDAPLRAVWNALTTDDGLARWWGTAARVDARAGGRVVLTQVGADGAPVELRGMFHEFRPTRKIEIAWDGVGASPSKGSRVAFQVARDGEETHVSVVHSGGGALADDGQRAILDDGWRAALLRLRSSLEGGASAT